jgi:signal transduction histidine kinase
VVHAIFWGLVPLTVVIATLVLAFGLGGSDARPPKDPVGARRRVLQLPRRLAFSVLAAEAVGLVALEIALRLVHAPLPVLVGLGLCTTAILALPPVPLYAFSSVSLLPLALELGEEKPPEGSRLSISVQLGYSVVAVAWAALVPAAVFGAAQLDVSAASDAQARAQLTAARLRDAAADLDVAAATNLLTHTPLSGGERTLLRAPSGTLLPEEAAGELDDLPYVEIPLQGALRGGALRVAYTARPLARGPLLAVTMVMLMFTLLLATAVGRAVARDLRGVTQQIDRIAREEEPGPLRSVASAEVRRLARAVNRLLERIPRFTVESFVAIERAEEAQRLKSQFLANMSHDLRSPLNSILGFSELLLRGIEGNITDNQRRALITVQDRGNQLLRLLSEILDTAKVESGKMELHRQSSPPAELVRAALQEARRGRPPAAADQVNVVLQPGLQPIHADPLRVTQAVTHLLNYAMDACDEAGGGGVTLRVAQNADGGKGRVFVIELEHPGEISDDQAEHLFDGFRRVMGKQGLHLALPLARRLAELHGGSLELIGRKPARLKLIVPLARLAVA